MDGSFHRRELKLPSISFSSPEGKRLFRIALEEGHLEGYFHLAEHYITQGHPAFCGVGSLTMALNSLLLDPGRVWQGVWRWFDESMLDCCEPLDIVKLNGITLPKLSCLARCNGAHSTLKYGTDVALDEFRKDVIAVSAAHSTTTTCSPTGADNCCKQNNKTTSLSPSDEKDQQRGECCSSGSSNEGVQCLSSTGRQVMIVSYCRRNLNQTGTGHFSPIGGYCAAEDMVLIMDVARFKYPPHWVPLSVLHSAMLAIDSETNKSRGYMILQALPNMQHRCECSSLCAGITLAAHTDDTGDTGVVTLPAIPVVEAGGAGSGNTATVISVSVPTTMNNDDCSGTGCIRTVEAVPNGNPDEPSFIVVKDEMTTPSARLNSLIGHSCPNCK